MMLTLIIFGVVVVITEIILWRLFHRKIIDVRFPTSMDMSSVRSFSVQRIRTFVIVHSFVLLVTTLIPLWLLW